MAYADIVESIRAASLVVADITPDSPNVYYEVGYAHVLAKPTILLGNRQREKLPFDVSSFRTVFCEDSIGGKSEVEERLRKHLEVIRRPTLGTSVPGSLSQR
jgi:nucleoside 2-deoxyribosyltransferase